MVVQDVEILLRKDLIDWHILIKHHHCLDWIIIGIAKDTNLLTVSIYGTIQAFKCNRKSRSNDYGAYKNDLTKVFKKKFQVVRDRNVGQQLIIYNVTLQRTTFGL